MWPWTRPDLSSSALPLSAHLLLSTRSASICRNNLFPCRQTSCFSDFSLCKNTTLNQLLTVSRMLSVYTVYLGVLTCDVLSAAMSSALTFGRLSALQVLLSYSHTHTQEVRHHYDPILSVMY